jgi:hypothetical protein
MVVHSLLTPSSLTPTLPPGPFPTADAASGTSLPAEVMERLERRLNTSLQPSPGLNSGKIDEKFLAALSRFATSHGMNVPPAQQGGALDADRLAALVALLLGEADPESVQRAVKTVGSQPSRSAPPMANPRGTRRASADNGTAFPLRSALNTGAAPGSNAFNPPGVGSNPATTASAPTSVSERSGLRGVAPADPADKKVIQASAQKLLAQHAAGKVRFWDGLSTGSELRKVQSLAGGQPAYVDKTGQAVWPNARMMQSLVEMAELPGGIHVNALTGGGHSANSNHYRGNAVDLDLNSGNAAQIADIAQRYGGRRNYESDHIHLDFK